MGKKKNHKLKLEPLTHRNGPRIDFATQNADHLVVDGDSQLNVRSNCRSYFAMILCVGEPRENV